MNAAGTFSVRRVGFRGGTEEELRALHEVETPVAAECGSNRMPAPLESYIAFARNLPSQFDDHAWLAEDPDAAPIGVGFCWSNSSGDVRVMECDVLVQRESRRQGVASQLLGAICEEAAAEARSLLTWSTYDAVPAGDAFSKSLGARVARVNRTSELVLDDTDWAMVERWSIAEEPRDLGYQLEAIDGPFPEHLRLDAATFHHIMQTAPRDNLETGDVQIDTDFVVELDQALLEAGRERWTLLVRSPGGACVGGTEVTLEPWQPGTVFQQNTGIDPAHRGLGLAKWVKATMLERIRREAVGAQRVKTDNAFSNSPILGINTSLGFRAISTRTEWQAEVDRLLRSLG